MDLKRYFYIYSVITFFSISIIIFSKLFSFIILTDEATFYPITLHSSRDIGNSKEFSYHMIPSEIVMVSSTVKNERFFNVENPAYLTFDDGPSKYTNSILDILKKHDVKATFFLLDGNIKKYPEIVERIVSEGHSLGCHGVSHRIDTFFKSPDSPLSEITTCSESIYTTTGINSKLYRVPFGSYPNMKNAYKKPLDDEGYIMWDWNIDSYDWKTNNSTQILTNIKKQIVPFQNATHAPAILLHDKEITSKALEPIIQLLKEKEFTMIPISESSTPVQFKEAE